MARLRLCCASGDHCDVRNAFGQERRGSDWPWYEAALACLRYCASVRIAEAHLERRTMVPYGPDWLVWLAGCDDACEATVRPASSWRGVDWMRWDGADDLELCRVRWRWQGYLTGDRGLAQISYSCTSPLMSDTAKYPTVRVSVQNMQHAAYKGRPYNIHRPCLSDASKYPTLCPAPSGCLPDFQLYSCKADVPGIPRGMVSLAFVEDAEDGP